MQLLFAVVALVVMAGFLGIMGLLNRAGRLEGLYAAQGTEEKPQDGEKVTAAMTRAWFVLAVVFAAAAPLLVALHGVWWGLPVLAAVYGVFWYAGRALQSQL